MTRLAPLALAFALTGCATISTADVQRATEIARQIEAGVKAGAKAYCGSPALQKAVLKVLRGRFPAADVLCQGATGEPTVVGVPGW